MKVILVNGSPKKEGNTKYVLDKVAKELEKRNIESEIIWIGNEKILGCLGCNLCKESKRCFVDDGVNTFLDKIEGAQGIIFASPVHFSNIPGMLSSFMDRAFYIKKELYKNKVVSGIAVLRRAGATGALDMMNKYFAMSNSIIATSGYWNMVYGTNRDELEKDEEGMQNIDNLVKNISYILQALDIAKQNNLEEQIYEKTVKTNFINY